MKKYETKHKLKCNADGKFRVLMMSDIQDCLQYDERSLRAVSALLNETNPDLVILGGDNCDGRQVTSLEQLKRFLDIFAAPMEERKIPWAHIYGNHDYDVKCDIAEQQALYESYSMCVSKHTDESVHGKSNFVLPIYDRTGNQVVFNVWGLDTKNRADALESLLPFGNTDIYKSLCLPQNAFDAVAWDIIYFDQLMWYWNTSCDMEKLCGQKIPGLMCMHLPLPEAVAVASNPEHCIKSGDYSDPIGTSALNSGLFATILERGDVKTIACGHAHENDFCGELCGIKICFTGSVGYNPFTTYGNDKTRGGRLFEIYEDDAWNVKTTMFHTNEMI